MRLLESTGESLSPGPPPGALSPTPSVDSQGRTPSVQRYMLRKFTVDDADKDVFARPSPSLSHRHLEADDLLLQLARADEERQRAESALVQAQTSLQAMRQERAALLQEAAEKDVRIHQLHLACSHLKEQVRL